MSLSLLPSSLLLLLQFIPSTTPQYPPNSPKFEKTSEDGLTELEENIQKHPDVVEHFFPGSLFRNIDQYRTEIPKSQDFGIGLIINPCGTTLPYDCCMGTFGDGEYAFLNDKAIDTYDVGYPEWRDMRSDFPIRAQEDEIVENINLVDANGQSKTLLTSRRADDEIVVDEECVAMHNPHPQCLGFRKRAQVSSLMAPCTDNNQTVDSMSSCFTPEGEELPHCMQVAYTQSSFIHICEGEFADNEHCGTFLEIHRTNGSPYDSETTVINSAKLTKREASGMVTTTMSLFYKGEEDKVLCNFKETVLRLGSMVLIKKNAPVCCCPSNYNTLKKEGMYFCPRKAGTKNGAYADTVDVLLEHLTNDETQKNYPFCLTMEEHEDILMCSKQSKGGFPVYAYSEDAKDLVVQSRFYTYQCDGVLYNETTSAYQSNDLQVDYASACPFFESCGLQPNTRLCGSAEKSDSSFTFAGEVGKITRMPKIVADQDALYDVTFNNGRTFYQFKIKDLELVEPKYNYELWFVQRTPYDFVVQQRKPFLVVSPKCTYDGINDQYFPFGFLNEGGAIMDTWDGGYTGNVPEPDYTNMTETFYDDRRLKSENE